MARATCATTTSSYMAACVKRIAKQIENREAMSVQESRIKGLSIECICREMDGEEGMSTQWRLIIVSDVKGGDGWIERESEVVNRNENG